MQGDENGDPISFFDTARNHDNVLLVRSVALSFESAVFGSRLTGEQWSRKGRQTDNCQSVYSSESNSFPRLIHVSTVLPTRNADMIISQTIPRVCQNQAQKVTPHEYSWS